MRKQSVSQIIGREGERWFPSVLPSEWLWQPPADDFGIDGTVAIGDERFVTPFEFGVQVKSCKKWEASDEHLLVRGVSTDVVRYWAIRLVPTMLVAYEVSSQRGFYAWIPDLVSGEDFANESATVTLKVPIAQRLDSHCWSDVKSRVLSYHLLVAAAIQKGHVVGAILSCINSLGQSLRILCFPIPRAELSGEQDMLWMVGQATAHRNVVTSIQTLASKFEDGEVFNQQLHAAAKAYSGLCSKVFHPFESLLESPDRTTAVWFNKETAALLLPQLLSQIAHLITTLSGTAIHSNATNTPLPVQSEKFGRNDPCPCGSGKKYKKCCGA